MNASAMVLLAILGSSLLPALALFAFPATVGRARAAITLGGALAEIALVALLVYGVYMQRTYYLRVPFGPGLDLVFLADPLSLLFLVLSSVLWFLTTIYAIGYLEHGDHKNRFFGFFSLCVFATVAIALAGNLFTFLVFYELLTLATYPLVVHRGDEKALGAGRIYLAYTLSGGLLLLVAIAWLWVLGAQHDFAAGGYLAAFALDPGTLAAVFALLVAGLGVKAALVPLHGWLPTAMVAPAPVSALLHAVAVVKAGAFGIARVVYDVFGVRYAERLGILRPLAVAASITILYGSLRALAQDELKRRLAYSTVSQVAYIALGVAIVGPIATAGGLVHIVHQGLMKITLFFCAGILSETLHIHHVSEMNGVGRRMPLTMAAFTVAALGMIGVPPIAGFVSKWHLATGGVAAGKPWFVAVLLLSTALNAAYFLPIVYRAWFLEPEKSSWPPPRLGRREGGWLLLGPTLATALLSLLAGVLASSSWSPLGWVQIIVEVEYGR